MQGAEKAWQVVVGLRRTHQSRDKLCQFPGRAGLILGSKVRASLLSFSSSFFFFFLSVSHLIFQPDMLCQVFKRLWVIALPVCYPRREKRARSVSEVGTTRSTPI